MITSNAPLTESLHKKWLLEISEVFKDFGINDTNGFLIQKKYFENIPERFYSRDVMNEYLFFLRKSKQQNPDILANLLKEYNKEIGLGYKILSEVNKSNIHDARPSDNHDDLLNFIDQKIHFAKLQVLETPFFIPLLIFEKLHRKIHGKGCGNIELFNITEGHIKNSNLSFIIEPYDNIVRNGIAHGNYYYTNVNIEYIDKKNNSVKKSPYEILDMFDDLIDYSNGLYLALITFFITEPNYIQNYNIAIPINILIEELKYKTKSPFWEVENCLESEGINIGKQINLYAKTTTTDISTIRALAFYSASVIENFTINKDRIFINIKSKNGAGCVPFDVKKLIEFRKSGYKDYECLTGCMEDGVFFMSFSKKILPNFSRLQTLIAAMKVQRQVFFNKDFKKPFQIRHNNIELKTTGDVVIADVKIVLNSMNVKNVEEYIRINHKFLIDTAIRDAKKSSSLFSFKKYLPVKYIRVLIYNSDFRMRRVRDSEYYVASIIYNKSKHIKTFDRTGNIEVLGDYRISWKIEENLHEL